MSFLRFIKTLKNLQVEVEEALDKVITTLKVFDTFRGAFREFRGKLPTYFPEGKKPKTWEFQALKNSVDSGHFCLN